MSIVDFFRHRIRFFILLLSSLCMTSTVSNMVTYNFTKICIDNATETILDGDNSTTHEKHQFSTLEKSFLQSGIAYGALAAQIPTSYLFQRFSQRYVFFVAGTISTVATALIPLADSISFWAFLVARAFQGVAFASIFPLSGLIIHDWAPLKEHGLFISLLTGCTQLSNIFTMPISGALCSSRFGWQAVYYVHASVSTVVFTLWLAFFRDTPGKMGIVTKYETEEIAAGKHEVADQHQRRSAVPYKAILTSPVVWAIWIAGFGDLIAVQLVSMFNPQYMKDVLGYTIAGTGLLAALPIVVQFAMKVISGVSSDALTSIGETTRLRIFNTIALGVSGVFFIVLAFVPREQRIWAIIILVITEGAIGCNTAGFNKCATLVSQQYTPFVMGHIMTIWCIAILIEPFFVNAILHGDNTPAVWRNVFLVHAVILIVTNFIFCIFAKSKPAQWTYESTKSNEKTEKQTDAKISFSDYSSDGSMNMPKM